VTPERFIPGPDEEHSSLAVQITVIVFWGMFFVGLLGAFLLLRNLEHDIRDRQVATADHVAQELGDLFANPGSVARAPIEAMLAHEISESGARGLVVQLGDERVVLGQTSSTLNTLTRSIPLRKTVSLQGSGSAQLTVFLPSVEETVATKRKEILVSLGGVLLIFGLILRQLLHRFITRPFERMTLAARAFTAGDPAQRFDEQRRDEFGFLARFINRALDYVMQQQHELRTALDRAQASETALFAEKERAEVTLHSIGDAVITTDAGGCIEYLNPMAERLTGWESAGVRGQPLQTRLQLLDETSRMPIENPVERCLRDDRVVGSNEQVMLMRDNGEEVDISHSAAPIHDRHGNIVGAVLVFHDVGQARRLTRELTHQATHDSLTGLLNRAEFERQLLQLVEATRPDPRGHAMCYLDMDQFKVVNDTCGHTAGDELLRQFASLLREQMRDSDVVARLGGDEFGILLIHCDPEHAERALHGLIEKIRKYRFVWEEHSFDINASIGLVSIPPGQHSLSQIMSAADVACYAAKDAGRNRLHIYHPEDDELHQRHTDRQWVSRLRKAIDENRFCLYAQPIVPVTRPDTPDHYEILVRLRDEQGRLVPPNTFIPAAERYNLMPQIDRWVLRTTLGFLRDLSGNCQVAVNVSGQSLCDAGFLRFAIDQINETGIDPGRICFEITETAAIAHLNLASRFISMLHGIGCSFSLDDFGSGLSSFAYLKNLKVDYLKIDGRFVKNMVNDPIDRAMVTAIHGVGQAKGIRTIAEFVETPEILAALAVIGVNNAQGYGIAKPMPIEECLPARPSAPASQSGRGADGPLQEIVW
jgi:diguanylate cyclase (GGDEF)-like protein/PAS domain S-box-containing protein